MAEAQNVKRVTKMCCVPQCDNKWGSNFSFHQFPKDLKLRKSWENSLRMGKPASDSMKVCSEHFLANDFFPGSDKKQVKRLIPTRIPSQKIPTRSHDRIERPEIQAFKVQRKERLAKRSSKCKEMSSVDTASLASAEDPLLPAESLEVSSAPEKATYVEAATQTSEPEVQMIKPKISLVDMLSSVERLKCFTGLYSFELLSTLEECLTDLAPTQQKELSLKTRVILTFTKLKMNLKFVHLETLFGVSRTTCSTYFKEIVSQLRVIMEVVIPWPEHESIKMNLPIAFKNYRNTRIVLDCAETPIEKSKCLRCRILTWSNYKGKQTAKFDVGVTPSGLISHISQSYGGRASDKLIVNHSGILDKLIFQDGVMTDKGFRIEEECLRRNLILHRPPFVVKKQQLSRFDALHCAEIARARVHVERVIQRIREFDFMCEPVPWEILPYFDDILVIVCGIVNLGPPVLNIDKFM